MREKTPHYGTLRETGPASVGLTNGDTERAHVGCSSADGRIERQEGTALTGNVSKTYSADSASSLRRLAVCAKENALLIALVSSLVIGVVLGCSLRLLTTPLSEKQQVYLQFPGEILMNMLKLLILPLIVSSLISGMTSLDNAASGKMIARAVCYYLCSMLLAVILGIILVVSIRPGSRGDGLRVDTEDDHHTEHNVQASDTFLDLIRQLFPDNLVEACFSKRVTKLTPFSGKENGTHAGTEYKRSLVREEGINMLGLVVASLVLGIAINNMGDRGRPLRDFVNALMQATILIVNAVIWFSPIGILFLVAAQIVRLKDASDTLEQLGLFMVTVVLGLALHGLVVLPLLFFILVRKNPYRFMSGMFQAMMTALGTSSSSATLPVTMRNLEENNGVDSRVISFVIPVGATINMDGTALYEAVATIFIGQMNGLDLNLGKIITICITATAAAIGAAGVPQAGLVTIVIVLESVGFPTSGIAVVLALDWMLDRLRTVVNVLGDAYGAGIVDHFCRNEADNLGLMDQVALTFDESDSDHAGVTEADAKSKMAVHQTSFCDR